MGQARVSKTPDALRISLSLNEKKPDFALAVNTLSESLNKLRQELEKSGFSPEQVTTANYAVNQNFKYTGGKSEPDGYQASVQVNVEIYFRQELLQTLYEAISRAGQKPNIQLTFYVKETEGISEDLRVAAVNDARKKAMSIAAAAGLSLGAIQRINYGGADPHGPAMQKTAMRMDAAMEAPDLSPGAMEFSDAVRIVWELK
jgi:uncharacterized protein YggE